MPTTTVIHTEKALRVSRFAYIRRIAQKFGVEFGHQDLSIKMSQDATGGPFTISVCLPTEYLEKFALCDHILGGMFDEFLAKFDN